MQTQKKETVAVKGVHIMSLCDARSEKAQEFSDIFEGLRKKREKVLQNRDLATGKALRQQKGLLFVRRIHIEAAKKCHKLWEEYQYYKRAYNKLFLVSETVTKNIMTTVGRSVSAQICGGDNTYSGNVNYTALGDDNTAPVIADATLGNETTRKALSSGTDASNITYLETFLTAVEAVDTHEEYGMFIDGAAGADTGQLLNRWIETKVKSNVETLNVQSILTWADA